MTYYYGKRWSLERAQPGFHLNKKIFPYSVNSYTSIGMSSHLCLRNPACLSHAPFAGSLQAAGISESYYYLMSN